MNPPDPNSRYRRSYRKNGRNPRKGKRMSRYTQDELREAVASAVEQYGKRLCIVGYDINDSTVSVDVEVEPEKRKTVTIVEPAQIRTIHFQMEDEGRISYEFKAEENEQSVYEQSRQAMALRCFVSAIMKQLSGNEKRKGRAT